MPYNWTPDTEKALLLAAIQEADLKPSKTAWANIATTLGGGLTASAVSQKFNKIKSSVASSAPVTPVKKNTTGKSKGGASGNRSGGGTKRKQAPSDMITDDDDDDDDDDMMPKVEEDASDAMSMESTQVLSINGTESASKRVKLECDQADAVVGSVNGSNDVKGSSDVNGHVGMVSPDGEEDDDNTDDV